MAERSVAARKIPRGAVVLVLTQREAGVARSVAAALMDAGEFNVNPQDGAALERFIAKVDAERRRDRCFKN